MDNRIKELLGKLEKIDTMLSDEELYLLQNEYDRLLKIAKSKSKPVHKEILRLHGMVCFLSAWTVTRSDKRSL
jgi:hypothetical protein